MNDLINIENKDGLLLVSSREIAERFEKRHNDVVKVIESKINILTTENFVVKKYFIESSFFHNGNEYKEILLTRDGFSFIALGFTGSKADVWRLRYIEAFNQMESEIKRINQPQGEEFMALAVLQAQKIIDSRDAQLRDQRSKVLLAEAFTASETSIEVKELAKILAQKGVDTGPNKLFDWLRTNKYVYYDGKYNIPMQEYINNGLLEIEHVPFTKPYGEHDVSIKTMVTVKGQEYFIKKFLG